MFQLNPDNLLASRLLRENLIFERREYEQLHNPLAWTDYLFELAKSGNFPAMLEHLNRDYRWTPGNLSNQPLQQEKNLFICLVTLLNYKVLLQHLADDEPTFYLADTAIQMIDQAKNTEEAKASLCSYLYLLTELLQKQEQSTSHHLVALTKNYIHKHLNNRINLTQLASQLNTSLSYLSRVFKQEEKITIQTYIQQERIQRAKQLLAHSDLSLLHISQQVGFTSQSHFGKVMKDLEGMTPRQYRLLFNPHYSHV